MDAVEEVNHESVEFLGLVEHGCGEVVRHPSEVAAGKNIKELRKELERTYLVRLFKDSGGDLARMADELEMQVSNLYNWFRRVGVSIRKLRQER